MKRKGLDDYVFNVTDSSPEKVANNYVTNDEKLAGIAYSRKCIHTKQNAYKHPNVGRVAPAF